MMNIYSKIYELCSVRNMGGVYKNKPNSPPPRVKYIMSLLSKENIDYEIDRFDIKNTWSNIYTTCYNVILKGYSDKMLVAHHDIVNPNIDNANDNSASIINAIAVKKIMPHINVVLLDGEEVGGLGSQRVSDQIKSGYFGKIEWVLNLELSGIGGENFFIGNYSGNLFRHIKSLFNCPVFNTPYNDSVTFRKNGIDSCVINPLPVLPAGKKSRIRRQDGLFLKDDMLFNCHNERDSLDTIDTNDMELFVENVVLKILK